MADIDSLSIQISSDSSNAVKGLEKLSATLETLRNATKGGLGLSSVANQIKKLSDSANSVNSTTIDNLKGLAEGMKKLSEIGDFKISSSIANQLTKINTALSGLNVGDGANKITELVSALRPLETLGRSSLNTTVNALNRLPEALRNIDTRQLYTQIQSLTRIFRPLAEVMQQVANGFNAFPTRIQRLIADNERLCNSNNRTSTSYINLWARMRMAYMGIRLVTRTIAGFIKKSNDYVENMNLFTASMGQYASEAQKYAEQVGEIMGIDPGEWMRNQGVFMTLATGFGVVGDRANIMSKNLTQLGYDISSFFNISTEDAMLKLQSGLAGELEPLRRIGYDLSQARLQQEAYTLGITKKISKMTQAEKAELRYHAILTQVTTAQGDMARTLNAPANQLRVLKAQVEMAGRAIGNIFIPALNAILPVAIAVIKVIRLIAESIANLFGYELPEVDYSGINGMASGADDLSNALDGASDSAKKLQKYTMGFDELNVIDPNQGSGSGGNSGGAGGSGFDFELPEYDFLNGAVESRATEIFEKIKGRAGEVLAVVGAIGGAMLAWKISNTLFTSINALINLLRNPVLTNPITITGGVILLATGLILEFTGVKSAIINGLDTLNFAEIVGGGSAIVAGGALIGNALGSAIIGASIGGIIAGIPMIFVGIYDACKNGLDWLNGILIPLGTTATGASIGAIIGALGGPIGVGIGALIGLAIGALTDIGILIYQKWDEIKAYFAPFWNWLYDTVVSPIVTFFSGVAEWFSTTVIEPIKAFFQPVADAFVEIFTLAQTKATEIIDGVKTAVGTIADKFQEIFDKIKEILVALGKAFDEYVITPVVDWVKDFAGVINEKVVQPIKELFSKVGEWFKTNIIDPIWEKLEKLRDDAVDLFKKVGITVVNFLSDTFKAVINGILATIEKTINGFLRLLNGAISLINEIPGVNIEKVDLINIPRLAEGGGVATGQMFIAREAGAELVGNIGRKTAVMNNEQIVASVARGVADANSEQNSLLREQNSLLRSLLEKDSGVYLDGKRLTNSVEKYQSQRGRQIVVGGAL